MREHLKHTNSTIPGWDGKPTQTPTSYMMTTKFKGVQVAEFDGEWWFTKPLSSTQQQPACALHADRQVYPGVGTDRRLVVEEEWNWKKARSENIPREAVREGKCELPSFLSLI